MTKLCSGLPVYTGLLSFITLHLYSDNEFEFAEFAMAGNKLRTYR